MAQKKAKPKKKIYLVKDANSPSGYTIISGRGTGVPATFYEIELWNMYLDAVAAAARSRAGKGTISVPVREVKVG